MVKTFLTEKKLDGFNIPQYPNVGSGELKFNLGELLGNEKFHTYGSLLRVKSVTVHVAPTNVTGGTSVDYALIPKRSISAISYAKDSAFDESGVVMKTMFFAKKNANDTGYNPRNQIQCVFPYPKVPVKKVHSLSSTLKSTKDGVNVDGNIS